MIKIVKCFLNIILLINVSLASDVIQAFINYRNNLRNEALINQIPSQSSDMAIKSALILPEQRKMILGKVVDQRPSLENNFVTSEGNFKIHYSIIGNDAIDSTDFDNNGIPDYADEVGRTAEIAYRLLIDNKGAHYEDSFDTASTQ